MKTGGGYVASKNDSIIPRYPLKDAGITLPMVWAGLGKIGLLPPTFFWERLYKEVVRILGSNDFDDFLPWEFHTLFAGRTRPNCSYCFFMRLYELVWMLETHPEIFWKGARIEESTGAEGYSFIQNWPYSRIYEFREEIFKKRVDAVLGLIAQKRQGVLFPVEPGDELSMVSCGIFCGK